MSKDFIELDDSRYGDKYIVNINNITFVANNSKAVLLSGVTFEGNSIINITNESHERLMRMVKDRMWNGE